MVTVCKSVRLDIAGKIRAVSTTQTRPLQLINKRHTITLSPNRDRHRQQYAKFGAALTELDREWRIARGESPNPWGIDTSAGFTTQQIITRHKLSKLERRSLETPEHE